MSVYGDLKPYASRPDQSRGRFYEQEKSENRNAFQRDRDRIIHSAAFRKLKFKTQVFVYHEGDYFRTRLTHSLEVSQIARSICRTLGLNEDLGEALALAHDLGHPPFGHAGERSLDQMMKAAGVESGFDHNEQAIRILTFLEHRYGAHDGLNLTWESIEGIAKHNGPLHQVPPSIKRLDEDWPLELTSHSSLEAQVAALADDIAYNNHDIDDGVRAGLFELDELRVVPLIADLLNEVDQLYPGLATERRTFELVRRMINYMVTDVVDHTNENLKETRPDTVADVRSAGVTFVGMSEAMKDNDRILREFLFTRMYRHHRANKMMAQVQSVTKDLFDYFMNEPQALPLDWTFLGDNSSDQARARLVCDYIAGMTDRFALEEHRRIFDIYSRT
ncbi:deoxyguanosinetriphosphate triphosphohydrolase [Alphaproteobacteria bacterium]|nr:deoxyguanosinetriphosphate triphosphohydrolase [Alphaproteobacteria bacterium]